VESATSQAQEIQTPAHLAGSVLRTTGTTESE